jgi:hypothetical protein
VYSSSERIGVTKARRNDRNGRNGRNVYAGVEKLGKALLIKRLIADGWGAELRGPLANRYARGTASPAYRHGSHQ